jgi:hypothetical protein
MPLYEISPSENSPDRRLVGKVFYGGIIAKSEASLIRYSILTAVSFGFVCRLSEYSIATSLWYDESFVALNVVHKTLLGMLGPLELNESSPPGFLMAEKLIVGEFGQSEYLLRLIPLMAGLASLIFFALLARRVCFPNGYAPLWAVIIMAGSPFLITSTAEVKHFSLDLMFAILLISVVIRICRDQTAIAWLLVEWGILGALAIWMSFSSVFVFMGTSLALAVRSSHWSWPQRTAFAVSNAITIGALWVLLGPIRAQRSAGLMEYWIRARSFPKTWDPISNFYWLIGVLIKLSGFFWHFPGLVLFFIAVVGAVSLWRTERKPELLFLLLPLMVALGANVAHLWPFGGNQHMAFAAPAVLLLIGEGTEILRLRLKRLHKGAGSVWIGAVLLPGVVSAGYGIVHPARNFEFRPVVEFVKHRLEPDDQLIACDPATVEFYMGRSLSARFDSLDPRARVWFISARFRGSPYAAKAVLDHLQNSRKLLCKIEGSSAGAFLFAPEASGKNEFVPGHPRNDPIREGTVTIPFYIVIQ